MSRPAGGRPRRGIRWRLALAVAAACTGAALSGCTADPGYRGRASREWIAQLAEPAVDRRADAASALGEVLALQPNAPKVVGALVGALADTSDPVRVAAAAAIRNAARGGGRVRAQLERDAVPAVAALLADSAHPAVRVQAVQVLADFGAPASVGALGPALRDRDPAVRRQAAEALGRLGPAAQPAVPQLVGAARDGNVVVRRAAARALAQVGGPPAAVGPALAAALRDPAPAVREAAAAGMAVGMGARGPAGLPEWTAPGAGGGPGAQALAALRAVAAGDPDARVRRAAVTALGVAGDSAAGPVLRRALGDPDAAVRREAEHALSGRHQRGGEDPPPPEPSLLELCTANPSRRGC